jgi:hypothetical protein
LLKDADLLFSWATARCRRYLIEAPWGVCAGCADFAPSAKTGIGEGRGGSTLKRRANERSTIKDNGMPASTVEPEPLRLARRRRRSKGWGRTFPHGGEALAEVAAFLMTASGAAEPGRINVAIEIRHGPVVEASIARGLDLGPAARPRVRPVSDEVRAQTASGCTAFPQQPGSSAI